MGKVLTLDQLKRRGWSLVNRCVMFGGRIDSRSHFVACGTT